MRHKHLMRCKECKAENYLGDRNKTKQPEKLETKKFCPKCNSHTIHTEKSKFS